MFDKELSNLWTAILYFILYIFHTVSCRYFYWNYPLFWSHTSNQEVYFLEKKTK